jgi:hypothetical protein
MLATGRLSERLRRTNPKAGVPRTNVLLAALFLVINLEVNPMSRVPIRVSVFDAEAEPPELLWRTGMIPGADAVVPGDCLGFGSNQVRRVARLATRREVRLG